MITTIVILTVTAQLVVQYTLAQQKNDARIINLAGRQRMLSQKIAKMVYQCRYGNCDYEQIQADGREWNIVHLGLQQGNAERGLPELEDEKIKGLFSEINPYQKQIYDQIADFHDTTNLGNVIYALQLSEYAFLDKMDEIVLAFEQSAESKLNNFVFLEVLLALLSMCILIFEVLFVVRPSFKHIAYQNAILKKITWKHSHEVRKPVANIIGLASIIDKDNLHSENLKTVEYIQQSAEELDQIIHEIVESANGSGKSK